MTSPDSHLQLGIHYLNKQQEQDAISEFNEAIRQNPNLAEAYYQRANAYRALRQYKKARDDYEEALNLRPTHAETHLWLGTCLAKSLDRDGAIEKYSQAIDLDSTLAEAYLQRGKQYYDTSRDEQALSDLEAALRIDASLWEANDFRKLVVGRLRESTKFAEIMTGKETNDTVAVAPPVGRSVTRRVTPTPSSDIIYSLRQNKKVQRIAGQLEVFQRKSIRIRATLSETEDNLQPGISKLGGLPDLPENTTWPTRKLELPSWLAPSATGIPVDANGAFALPFIAQLRIADLKLYDVDNLLPSSGMLYFFYAGCDHGLLPGNWQVFWRANTNELKQTFPPIPIPPRATYRACTLSFENETTLPHVETCWIGSPENPRAKLVLTQEQWDAYADFLYELRANQSIHQMLGHSDDVQPYALEGGYNLVRNELFADSKILSENELQKEWEQSRLLLQVDEEVNGMRFGRAGRLYFFVRESDLRRNDFSKVWAIEQ